jgi:hypothetical protein
MLRCKSISKPTCGINHKIVLWPGKNIEAENRITHKIYSLADKKGWIKPHWEVGCLIREAFTDDELAQMGLWYIATMCPINKSDRYDGPGVLCSYRGEGGKWLYGGQGYPGAKWSADGGFAFEDSSMLEINTCS